MRRLGWMSGCLGLAMVAGACVGNIGGGNQDGPGRAEQGLCEDGTVSVGQAPLRRLTAHEYDNAIRDLLGDTSHPAAGFVADETVAGFEANAVAPVTKLQVQDYLSSAEDVASRAVTERLDTLIDCDVAQASCVTTFVDRVGRRAFRRPLTAEERDALLDVYRDGRERWNATKGFELMLQTMLLAPQFLYVVEAGEGAPGEVVALDGFAIAARLSLFLWQSVPDDILMDAAEAGELDTREGIAEQAKRMLADERARALVQSFFGQWLEIEHLEEQLKNETHFPEWNAELAQAMRDETLTFAERVLQDGGTLETLLTAPYTYGNEALATLYGAEGPDADGKINLDPSQRAGLLTQASFLTSTAHIDDPSWVFRGLFIRESLLCKPLPPPPPNVDMNESNDPDRLTNDQCKACHLSMDPIGWGFDQYDAIGRFDESVTVEGAEVINAGDLSGPFDSPVELAKRLAGSDEVRRCVATHVYRYATRRAESRDDSCSIDRVDGQFADSGSSMLELLIAVAQSDGFRFRRIPD